MQHKFCSVCKQIAIYVSLFVNVYKSSFYMTFQNETSPVSQLSRTLRISLLLFTVFVQFHSTSKYNWNYQKWNYSPEISTPLCSPQKWPWPVLTSFDHFQRQLDSSALNACDITWAVLCGSKKLRLGFVLWALWPHIRSACLAMSRLAVLIHFAVTNVRNFRRCLFADGARRLFRCCDWGSRT